MPTDTTELTGIMKLNSRVQADCVMQAIGTHIGHSGSRRSCRNDDRLARPRNIVAHLSHRTPSREAG